MRHSSLKLILKNICHLGNNTCRPPFLNLPLTDGKQVNNPGMSLCSPQGNCSKTFLSFGNLVAPPSTVHGS